MCFTTRFEQYTSHKTRYTTYMTTLGKALVLAGIIIIGVAAYFLLRIPAPQTTPLEPVDATPQAMTISGTYVCLPHLDTTGPQTEECAFGIKTDNGDYYAINFGQSAGAMEEFQSGAYIKAEGFVVIKEALSSSQWAKYNMKGVFTVTKKLPETNPVQGKIDINAVCDGALAYMTFPDGASAATFVADCKEGKHPEVIERFKADMNLGAGATI